MSAPALCLCLGLVALLAACAPWSPSASASGSFQADGQVDGSADAITYRELRRADFAAPQPAARFLSHASALGAVICAEIRATPDSWFHTSRETRRDGSSYWVAIVDHLRFRAEMQPSCSWWNPRVDASLAPRILQHEQAHFGLFELAARHLNERIAMLVIAFRFTADTEEEAERAAVRYVRDLERLAMEEIQARNEAYDRETNYGARRLAQQDWMARVQTELLATARFAAVSDPPWPPLDAPADPAP
jgi:hypothetical protein